MPRRTRRPASGQLDVTAELERLRSMRAVTMKRPYRCSKLEPFRAELVKMRQAGATVAELAWWVRHTKFTPVVQSTVARYLEHLPELEGLDVDRRFRPSSQLDLFGGDNGKA